MKSLSINLYLFISSLSKIKRLFLHCIKNLKALSDLSLFNKLETNLMVLNVAGALFLKNQINNYKNKELELDILDETFKYPTLFKKTNDSKDSYIEHTAGFSWVSWYSIIFYILFVIIIISLGIYFFIIITISIGILSILFSREDIYKI